MKKNGLLLLSILLLVVSFTVHWFGDHLFSTFWVLVFHVYLLLLGCFIALLVLTVRQIRRDRRGYAGLAVLALLAALVVFFPFRDAKVKLELNLYDAPRQEVLEMIRTGELSPNDGIGNIRLPMGYRRLSADGEVFLYQNDDAGQVVGFWILRAREGSHRLIYSSGGEELIRENEPYIMSIERLKDHWYYVVTD